MKHPPLLQVGGGVEGSEGSGGDNDEGQVKRRRLVAEAKNEGNNGIGGFFFCWGERGRNLLCIA